MRSIDRIIVIIASLGLWALAAVQLQAPQAHATYELTRHDVAAVMRNVLKQSKPVTSQEMRSIMSQLLANCQITGHLSDEENTKGDTVDFRARLQC